MPEISSKKTTLSTEAFYEVLKNQPGVKLVPPPEANIPKKLNLYALEKIKIPPAFLEKQLGVVIGFLNVIFLAPDLSKIFLLPSA